MIDCLHKFLAMANENPEALAVSDRYGDINYFELSQHVCRLGSMLQKLKINSRILIISEQNRYAYIAMFATLYAGCLYTVVNLDSPVEKIKQLIIQFSPHLILTIKSRRNLCQSYDIENTSCVLIEETTSEICHPPRMGHLAYIAFTSGSTGIPKGVIISRTALSHFVNSAGSAMRININDRCSQHPNLAFDLSVLDVYGALCYGASLHPLEYTHDRYFPARFIKKRRLTIWNSVPSIINLMFNASEINFDNLATVRLFTFCGESLYRHHLRWIFSANSKCIIYNTYGPTEATVYCTLLKITHDNYEKYCRRTVALGAPNPGIELVLDKEPKGQLLIGGVQLANGYWNNESQTCDKFRLSNQGKLFFFTGDIVERINNQLYFVERADFQVKINGHRVELNEIEAVLHKIGYHNVIVHYDGQILHAVFEKVNSLDVKTLLAELRMYLDDHAIPKQFHFISKLPRNVNDKIDRLKAINIIGLDIKKYNILKT